MAGIVRINYIILALSLFMGVFFFIYLPIAILGAFHRDDLCREHSLNQLVFMLKYAIAMCIVVACFLFSPLVAAVLLVIIYWRAVMFCMNGVREMNEEYIPIR